MTDTLFDGITARTIETDRIRVNILERAGDDPQTAPEKTVILVHGNVSSALFWQEQMLALPSDLRIIAVDLRGFGASETAPLDATRGVRDFSDDIAATLRALDIPNAHFVGWSMGGGIVMQYALDYPVLSLTLQAPVSPYGFGGTDREGKALTTDDAGCGGGGGNPDFVAALRAGDTGDASPTSPRNVLRGSYVAPGYTSEYEDVWVASMLTTSTDPGNYPGDARASENWPGFAAGTVGVLNTMVPKYFNVSGIIDLAEKPPILWIHGSADVIVSDASFFDINSLGAVGVIPGWPGEDVAPAQLMKTQTRDVLAAYSAAGGRVVEIELDGVGHSPHLEAPEAFREALVALISSRARRASEQY